MAKPRPCTAPECPYPALPRRQRCGWHHLARQPIAEQLAAAASRLARVPAERRVARLAPDRWPAGTRFCSGCQSLVPLWYTSSSRCKACASKASHSSRVQATYGISGAEYDRLLALQGGRCAICRALPRSMRLAVDHDHATGVVRGLLCSGERGCNHGLLGAAHDDIEILRAAVAYMEAPPAAGEVVVDGVRRTWAPPVKESAQAESDDVIPF